MIWLSSFISLFFFNITTSRMKFSLVLVSSFALLSSTTSATPVDQKSGGRSISLSKRGSFTGPDGTDTNALRDHLSHATAYALYSYLDCTNIDIF